MAEVIDIPGIDMLNEPADYEKLGYDRRHSTGKIMIPPRIRAKVLSRYLKEPAGSCHDNCKSGLKHEPEQKQRPHVPVRVTRASKAETSPKPSSARNSQKIDATCKTGQTKSEGRDLKMDATVSMGCDESGVVHEASSDLQTLNHEDPAPREGHDVETAASSLADKEIITENHPGPSHDLLETDNFIVRVLQIDGKCKNLEAPTSSSDERKMSSENNQNRSSDTCTQEVNSPKKMAIPSEVSTSNQEALTIRIADEQLESEIDLQPSESKVPEGNVTAAVIEKASELCQGQVVNDAETKLEKMKKKKKQGVHCNKPVSHSKSQQSAIQTSIRKNAATVIKPDTDSQVLVPSHPKKSYVPRRNARGSTTRISTPVYIPKHGSVRDGEETSCPTNPEELSGSRNKDGTRLNKEMRISMIRNKGSQVVPSVSSRVLDNRVSGMKGRCRNLKKVPSSEENGNNMKVETKNLKGVYRLKNQGAIKDDIDEGSGIYPPEKTLHIIETEPENKFMASNTKNAHGNNMSMSSSSLEAKSFEKNNNRVPTGRSPPHSENKNVRRKAVHASRSVASSSSPKNMSRKRIQDGIYNHRLSSSTLFSVESSKSSLRSASSNHKKANTDRKARRMEMTPMHNPTRARQNILNDKQTGKTLRFKRGKVIDLQPVDCTPKRLKFRKRVLQDQGTADGQRRGDLGNKIAEKRMYVPNGTTSESNSEKVLLRHQNLDTNNKSPSLLNNVIEETTSKLVKSRSKVKALVTAFEAVISLQDINPSPTTTVQ